MIANEKPFRLVVVLDWEHGSCSDVARLNYVRRITANNLQSAVSKARKFIKVQIDKWGHSVAFRLGARITRERKCQWEVYYNSIEWCRRIVRFKVKEVFRGCTPVATELHRRFY